MERWDLYTKDRTKTGETMSRSERVPQGRYHIVIHVCLFNAKGEMLIQQRQPYKRSWAGLWDVSVGGCALAGESSREAAEREAREELGYSLSLQDVAPALTLYPRGVLNDVYLVERQIDLSALTLQPEEVRSVKWATEKKIKNMIDEGTFIPYQKDYISLLFFLRSHQNIRTRPDLSRRKNVRFYCPACHLLLEGITCPQCGQLGRPPARGDLCFLADIPLALSGRIEAALRPCGIPFTLEAAKHTDESSGQAHVCVLVPCASLAKAREQTASLLLAEGDL